jgi:methyl-accepting chemotaxis protein
MNNFKVGTRLFCLIDFMSLLLVSIGVLGLRTAKQSDDALDTVYQDRVVPLKDLKDIADMYAVNIVDTSHKVRNGSLKWDEGRKNVADAQKTIAEKWKAYLATTLVAEEKKLVEEAKHLMSKADVAVVKLSDILKREHSEELSKFTISELYPAIDPVSEKFSALVDIQLVVAKQEWEKSSRQYDQTKLISIAAIVTGVLLSSMIGLLIVRSITRSLSIGVEVANRLASGDLTVAVDAAGKDEIAQLMTALKEMVMKLRSIISDVSSTSNQVAAAATQR